MNKDNIKNGSIQGIISSDLPISEVISTLTKRVAESEVHTPDYNYILTAIFGKQMVFDGLKDVNYVEYVTDTTGTPYSNVVIGDFNATSNITIRETVEATEQSNVKTKILDSVMINFRANPSDAVAIAYTNTVNIQKTQELYWEGEMWTELLANEYTEDVNGLPDISTDDTNSVNKVIYNTLTSLGTTSKTHPSIGTDGVITVDNGDNAQPAYRFNSNEFYLIKTPEFNTNTVFDGERSFFNWDGSQLELAGTRTIDFTIYEGVTPALFLNLKAILLHKDALLNIMDWEASKVAIGPKLYTVIHNYLKTNTYKRKNKPAIFFRDVPALLNKKGKQDKKVEVEEILEIKKVNKIKK